MSSWTQRVPKNYTKPEMTVFNILTELGIRFKTQIIIGTKFREVPYVVDFLILEPENHILEVLGRRWHDHSNTQRKKVEVKRACLENSGFKLLEIWDDEISRKRDLPIVKEKIRQWLVG